MTEPAPEQGQDPLLSEAIRVLTAAARAGWDWAEFVALACAGAAANVGGVEEILSQRSGSWEATFVRNLLVGTVSEDETYLWERRTEPVTITLNVDDLLADLSDPSFEEYDEASAELERRAEAAAPPVDVAHYAWAYRKNPAGEWTGEDPAAPAWSRDDWRAGALEEGLDPDELTDLETRMDRLDWNGAAFLIPKYPGAMADLTLVEQAGQDAAAPYLEDQLRLENQRLQEQRDFGEALAERIRAAVVTVLPGLTVPVDITVVVDQPTGVDPVGPDPAARRLLDHVAFSETGYPPIPSDLPGTPLQRLGVDPT